jgi:hypothetical protein
VCRRPFLTTAHSGGEPGPASDYLQKHADHSQAVLPRYSLLEIWVFHRIPVNYVQLKHSGKRI